MLLAKIAIWLTSQRLKDNKDILIELPVDWGTSDACLSICARIVWQVELCVFINAARLDRPSVWSRSDKTPKDRQRKGRGIVCSWRPFRLLGQWLCLIIVPDLHRKRFYLYDWCVSNFRTLKNPSKQYDGVHFWCGLHLSEQMMKQATTMVCRSVRDTRRLVITRNA